MKILMSLATLFIMTISVSFSQTASTETATTTNTKAQCASIKECAKKMGITEAECKAICKKVCTKDGDMSVAECAEKMGMTVAECKAKCLKGDTQVSTGETKVAAAVVTSEIAKLEKGEASEPACDKSKKACCKKKS